MKDEQTFDRVLARSEVVLNGRFYVSVDKFLDEIEDEVDYDLFFVALELEKHMDPSVQSLLVPEWPKDDYIGWDIAYPEDILKHAAANSRRMQRDGTDPSRIMNMVRESERAREERCAYLREYQVLASAV
jgi:hypothetical protein